MKAYICAALLCVVVCVEASSLKYAKGIPARRQSNEFVSFSAGLTSMVNLTTNSSVVYDQVYINTGNGYNSQTGVFTCPRAGVYVFLYHGLSETAGQMWLDLYKNGQYELTGYAHDTQGYAAASNSVVLTLAIGDTVFIKGHGSNQLYGATDEIYSTFSGYLIKALDGQN